MKIFFVLFYLLLFMGCNEENIINPTEDSTFGIYLLQDRAVSIGQIRNININELELEDIPWISSSDVDFYDYSSHCIYLKKDKIEFFTEEANIQMKDQPFIILANNIRCYVGSFHSGASSLAPTQPYIDEMSIHFFPSDILHISKAWGNEIDIRINENLEYDLKTKNKLHNGLSLSIKNVDVISNSDTAIVLYSYTITNNDKDNLYVLDPNKMGSDLFHYFTNGVSFWSSNRYIYSEYKKVEQPDPYDSWKPEWFVKIEGGSTIERTVFLKGYPQIPSGTYKCTLDFSNPSKIEKSARKLPDGRYWLGDIEAEIIKNVNL